MACELAYLQEVQAVRVPEVKKNKKQDEQQSVIVVHTVLCTTASPVE